MTNTETTYSVIHHQSGSEYIAQFRGGDVVLGAGPLTQSEVSTLTTESAQDWIDNQDAESLVLTAIDLNIWIEAREAWIVRSSLDPNIR